MLLGCNTDIGCTETDATNGKNCYALVTYIPDPLGRFLDDLRRSLVPGCNPHAHVTLMPPRPIQGPAPIAWNLIDSHIHDLPAFELEVTDVAVFPVTNVIYLELGLGRETLYRIHEALNKECLCYVEPFEYHPHITIAQELKADQVPAAVQFVRSMWEEWQRERNFWVEELTFVQNTTDNCWRDLASLQLEKVPVPVRRF